MKYLRFKLSEIDKKDVYIPILAYLVLVVFKLVFVIGHRTMPAITDEFSYAFYGKNLSELHTYRGYQYPLFYPLILAQAYWFGENNLYLTMEIINVFWSSLTVVFTYFIARNFMNYKKSMVAAAFAMVIPFQYSFSMMLLSENVYFPLLMLAILIMVNDSDKHQWFEAFFYGGVVGVLYLTRFVTLVLIPVFVLAWIMKKIHFKTPLKTAIGQFLLMSGTAIVAYMPFFAFQLKKGYSIKHLLGFSIAEKTHTEQLTVERLVMVAILYVCYFVIASIPVISGMIRSFWAIERDNICGRFNRLWILSWGLFGASFVAVVRHSWRAKYNFPEFERIKGRYLMYFPLIFAIVTTIVIFEKRTKIKNIFLNIALCYVLPVVSFVLAFLIYTKGWIFHFDAVTLNGNIEAIDGYKAIGNGLDYCIPVVIFILVVQFISDYGESISKRFNRRVIAKRIIPIVMAIGFVGCECLGATNAWAHVVNQQKDLKNNKLKYAEELSTLLDKLTPTYHERAYVYSEVYTYKAFTEKFVPYKYGASVVYVYETAATLDETIYVYTKKPKLYKDYTIETIGKIKYSDDNVHGTYYMIRIKPEGLKLAKGFISEE